MPDVAGAEAPEGGNEAENDGGNSKAGNDIDSDANAAASGLLSPPLLEAETSESKKDPQHVSESEDVADRAASMLQGLRDNMDGDRMRRRRETAEEERRKRRLRRRNGGSTSNNSAEGSAATSVPEPISPPRTDLEPDDATSPRSGDDPLPQPPLTPAIVVSPTADQQLRSPGDDELMEGSPSSRSIE